MGDTSERDGGLTGVWAAGGGAVELSVRLGWD